MKSSELRRKIDVNLSFGNRNISHYKAHHEWLNFLNNNLSVATSKLHGLYEMKTRCVSCNFNDIKFEPFSILNVNVPQLQKTQVEILVLG